MTEVSADEVKTVEVTKYRRGEHPASLSNLTPWKPGEAPNPNGIRGPLVTPHMRRFADLTVAELEAIIEDEMAHTAAEIIAAKTLLAAIEGVDRGDKARQTVLNRLDGEPEKAAPAVAVQVNLQFSDGSPA